VNQYPVIQLRYNYSPKGFLGSEYEYSRVMAQMYKRVNIPPLGYTNLTIEGAKLWGKYHFRCCSFIEPTKRIRIS
jgi:hypothetical protein